MKVEVKGPSLQPVVMEFENPLKAEEILKLVRDQMPYPVYSCKVDNCYQGLSHIVHRDCTVEFLDIRTTACWYVYQNSLVLLYLKAVHDVLGKDVLVTICNSLSKGLYTVIKTHYNSADIEKVEERMGELVKADLPIVKKHMNRREAIDLASSLKQTETKKLIESVKSLDNVEIYQLEDEVEIFYDFLVPSTGYLQYFELRPYRNGVLLRYPHPNSPIEIPEYQEQRLLYDAFAEASKWGRIMDINFVEDLNTRIDEDRMLDSYLMQEALHEKKISDIADQIATSKKRIVLICGPSSSGKTTFAKRLCIQLAVNGLQTLYLGTDDYFVERDMTPLDENGEKDYENIETVDIHLFVSNLQDLLDGKTVDLPRFDFKDGTKVFGERMTKIGKNDVIVIEGIHALNRLLTDGIDDEEKFKIYISPFTPISVDDHNRIPATDCRYIRRMVRDNQFRNMDVRTTIDSWPKVRKGEEKNIFPYTDEADVFFNSNCIYELAVLKKYAEPLLNDVRDDEPEYAEAQRLLAFLRFFQAATDDDKIINNSIIKEFIGGSIIVH